MGIFLAVGIFDVQSGHQQATSKSALLVSDAFVLRACFFDERRRSRA